MLDIYKEADYRFQNPDELVVGDIALLSIVEGSDAIEDEKNNVIAYYAGIEGGNHIFYACLSPEIHIVIIMEKKHHMCRRFLLKTAQNTQRWI